MRHRLLGALLLGFAAPALLPAAETALQQPSLVEKYTGGYKDDYFQELGRVRTFLGLAQQAISNQLGLVQYGQGFYHPVLIRFDDGVPAVSQNPFFYAIPLKEDKDFRQDLIVNVEAFARKRKEANWKDPDLRNGFYYAMTQLILNDVTHGKGLPVWIQEGLSVYVSGGGDDIVQEVASTVPRSKIEDLVGELNKPYPYLTKRQWARYFLSIQYIASTSGTTVLQTFVRDVVGGKSPADAVRDDLGQDWATFKKNVQLYSAKVYLPLMLPDSDPALQNPGASPDGY
jgi:hypothetical protein